VIGGVPVARIFGIEVRVSLAWAILIALVTLVGSQQASVTAPALPALAHWAIGLVVALGFLVTVVAHELAHALVGRRRGVAATMINLGFVGGLAPLTIDAPRPRDELAIAVAGPAVSLAIAVAAIGLAAGAGLGAGLGAGSGGGLLAAVSGALLVIGGLNLVLGLLSLLPGMPLDGGRVVRAIAWAGTGDRDRAGTITALVGRFLGWGLVACGVVLALADMVSGGLMTLCLGWFMATGSRTLDRRLDLERILRGATVGDATRRECPRVAPNLTVDTFADRFEGPDRVSCLPVVDGDTVLGVIGRRRVQRVGRGRLGSTRAVEIMATPPGAPFLVPDGDLWVAVELMNSAGFEGLAVVVDGALEGVVMRESIGDLIQLRAGRAAGAPAGGGST
jgi:Zn-dependent protease/CBS domain-containing protein